MSKATATLLVISGSKMMTDFMQCADVFEKSKVIGSLKTISVSYKEGQKVSLERTKLLIDSTKKALEAAGELVSFIHVSEVQNNNVVIKNQGEIAPYINKEVRCISNGKHWYVFSKFIEANTDLKVATDEHMFILSAGVSLGNINSKTIVY